tara:strand:+ start:43 stop:2562 length:2520 start_codon:yes stop_codon:yes gene_type:complete
MAEKVVFKVAADFDNAIKEWEQLRDKVATTTKEYQDAQKEIENLKKAKAELTGETIKSNEAFRKETKSQRESTSEYKKRKKDIEDAFKSQEVFNKSVGTSSVLSFDNSINATRKERDALIQLRNTLDITGDEFVSVSNKISILDQKLKTSSKGLSGSLNIVNKGLDGTDKASGAATSSAMELSRVISDAPYGIRGMANNITQLVSQLGYQANATDKVTGKTVGYRSAVKGMLGALTGPLGVVFAITAVVSVFDYLYGANKKVEESTNALINTFGEESTKLMVLKSALDDSSISLESKNELVKKANEEFSDLNITLDENGRLTKESADNIDMLSMSFVRNAKARAIAKLIQDELGEQAKIEAKKAGENLAWYETAYYGLINRVGGLTSGIAGAIKADSKNKEEALEDSKSSIDKYIKMLKDKDGELAKLLFGEPKNKKSKRSVKKISPFQTKEELELEAKSQLNAINSYNKKIELQENKNNERRELLLANSEEKKKAIKEKYAKMNLEIQLSYEEIGLDSSEYKETESANKKYKNYVKDLDKRLEAYKKNIKGKANADDLIKRAEVETSDKKESAKKELKSTIALIEGEYESLKEYFFELADARRDALGLGGEEKNEEELGFLAKNIDSYKELYSNVADFISAESDRQITIEQNKTNALNEELNNRLLNENLSKEERARIQNQIGQNDEKLRKKQEAIARKQFNTAKAFNIGMATVETYLAAQKAYTSQLTLDPTSPIRAKIAAGVAVASGLAKVAAIARTKFQSTSASTPVNIGGGGSGSGEGVGDREFNFNLVGNTQNNQLLETLQSQFEKPLQAFVVSKDITTQQELDANIRSGASI